MSVITQAGFTLTLDQERNTITITMPDNHSLQITSSGAGLNLGDQYGNRLTFGQQGIEIHSCGQLNLHAQQHIQLSAPADIHMDALNIRQTAKVSLCAHGAASAEFSASGQTTVKGAMVLIN